MPRIRLVLGVWLRFALSGVAATQELEEGLAAAARKIDAGEWAAALDVLLGLQEKAASEAELEQVAVKLAEVGDGLNDAAVFEAALRAHEAALAMRKRIHGDRDHPDVALGLDNVAACLRTLGGATEALPQFEAALAMNKRLYGDQDHPDVATNLKNLASCLGSLGRANQALAQCEAALAMRIRLYGDRDHPDVASSLSTLAYCLHSLGRADDALPQYEAALAMYMRLYGEGDHPDVATSMNHLAACLESLGRAGEALAQYEAALAMRKRFYVDRDHPHVAQSLNMVASCLQSLGRTSDVLPQYEEALAMRKRLDGDRDHPDVAISLCNAAHCLYSLGRAGEALSLCEAALAMYMRLYENSDHPDVASSVNKVAACLDSLGRAGEALPEYEASLAMYKRLYGDRDHPDVATSLNNLAACLYSLGRAGESLPQYEAALAMRKRLYGDRDHPDVATSLNNVASCLRSLGRAGDALPHHEASLAMNRCLYGNRDHPEVARSLNNGAICLQSLGRADDALPQYEAALAMRKRLYGDRDHPRVATSLNNVGDCLNSLGRVGKALPQYEAALAMRKRLYEDRDHPELAMSLNNVARCLQSLGRVVEALPQFDAALAMYKRLYSDRDHPYVAMSLNNLAHCLELLGRSESALGQCRLACAMIERLRDESRTSAMMRQSLFDNLKGYGAFERLQALSAKLHHPDESMHASERSRGRELLDLLEQQQFDGFSEAERRARQRGDDAVANRLPALRAEVETAEFESDRLLHLLTQLDDAELAEADRTARRQELIAQSNDVSLRRRQLFDERARLLGDVLPVGRVRTPAEIQAVLQTDELLLEFTVTRETSLLYVLAHEGDVEAISLPDAHATVRRVLPELLRRISRVQLPDARGPSPGAAALAAVDAAHPARELFASLIPDELWPRLKAARRVFVAAHRELHRLPFESLVSETKDGKPVYWLDDGPEVAYVQSGSALVWLRQRAKEASDGTPELDLLAIGDPRRLDAEPEVPEHGVFVASVNPGGEGDRVGLLSGDVLVSYDGMPLADDLSLRELRTETEAAIGDGRREKTAVPIEGWRRGTTVLLEVSGGLLGIQVGQGNARLAHEALLGSAAQMERITRAGDLERLARLPQLQGARAEAESITSAFQKHGRQAQRLLDQDATESAVFDLAVKARYLHFACHGIAEEYAGQSLSMLVLSQPRHMLPGDDGLLKLSDLFHGWPGRLNSCRLVVLSACRTNVGPTLRDEAPQALPLGFLFAGAPSVISSLWAVDDASTRKLMTDFYARLVAGETDRLNAFTAAKRGLRKKYPDPYHWAPFLYIGSPE